MSCETSNRSKTNPNRKNKHETGGEIVDGGHQHSALAEEHLVIFDFDSFSRMERYHVEPPVNIVWGGISNTEREKQNIEAAVSLI